MAKDLKTQVAELMTAQGLDPASVPLDNMKDGALLMLKDHLEKHNNITSIVVKSTAGFTINNFS